MLNHPDYTGPDARRRLFDEVRVTKARSRDLVDLLVPPAGRHAIEFEEPANTSIITGGLPVRWIMAPSKGTTKGYYPSPKNRESLVSESLTEQAAFSLLETDPWTTAYFPQPLQFEFPWYHGPRVYTPDIFVWRDRAPIIIEVKWTEKLAEYREILDFFEAYFAYKNIQFHRWTERFIFAPPRLDNARWLERRRLTRVSRDQRLTVMRFLETYGATSVARLATLLGGENSTAVIEALILRGLCTIDMTEPLRPDTLVYPFVRAAH